MPLARSLGPDELLAGELSASARTRMLVLKRHCPVASQEVSIDLSYNQEIIAATPGHRFAPSSEPKPRYLATRRNCNLNDPHKDCSKTNPIGYVDHFSISPPPQGATDFAPYIAIQVS